jgi:hypothetical protein
VHLPTDDRIKHTEKRNFHDFYFFAIDPILGIRLLLSRVETAILKTLFFAVFQKKCILNSTQNFVHQLEIRSPIHASQPWLSRLTGEIKNLVEYRPNWPKFDRLLVAEIKLRSFDRF